MKKILLLIICTFVVCIGSWSQLKPKVNMTDLVYSVYCAGSTIKDTVYLSAINFKEFNFYYIMSYPRWESVDFDKSMDDIIKKYITEFKYPSSLSGYGLTLSFIDSVHKAGGKVLLSLQGASFSEIAKIDSRREKFAKMIAAFVRKYDYDGFDLDWEGSLDIKLHYAFLKKLREELDVDKSKYYYITTALPSSLSYSKELADSLSSVIDWINLMTYDMGGGVWDKLATYNTPMSRIERNLKKWSVFDPSKLCIGLAAYGFYYHNLKPGERILSNQIMSDYGRYILYSTLVDSLKNKGWLEEWNDEEKVPYYFSPSGNDFITADNPRSIAYKIQWTINKGYRGLFWWELYSDYVTADDENKYGRMLLKSTLQDTIGTMKKN